MTDENAPGLKVGQAALIREDVGGEGSSRLDSQRSPAVKTLRQEAQA
jgi:hypothetical protein